MYGRGRVSPMVNGHLNVIGEATMYFSLLRCWIQVKVDHCSAPEWFSAFRNRCPAHLKYPEVESPRLRHISVASDHVKCMFLAVKKTKIFHFVVPKLLMINIDRMFARLFPVTSLLKFRYQILHSQFITRAGAALFLTAPTPAPSKTWRFRLRLQFRAKCVGSGSCFGSASLGSTLPAIY